MQISEISAVLGLLAAVLVMAEVARKFRLPYPTLMVIAGLLISLVPGLPSLRIDPGVVFYIFLPPILYSAAWNTWLHDFRRHAASIISLAVGLVLFTAIVVAQVAVMVIPGMSWWHGFLLGAIVSPPDAAAATAICQRLGVNRRIVTVLEGESLVNDASGLTAYHIAIIAITQGMFSPWHAAWELTVSAVGGVCVGLAVGFIMVQVHKRIREPLVTTALTLIAPYVAYLPADAYHMSGVLATVAAGLYVSRKSSQIFSAQARIQAVHVWDLLVLLMNGALFVLIGLQLKSAIDATSRDYNWQQLMGYILAVCAAVILARLVWVFPMSRISPLFVPASRRVPLPSWPAVAVVGWTGMRGIVSLAAAIALPIYSAAANDGLFAYRDLIILLAFGVIFATLVIQSLSLPFVIRLMGESVREVIENDELVARMVAANAAVTKLDAMTDAPQSSPEVQRVRSDYLDRLALAGREAAGELETLTRGRAKPEDCVRRVAISAEREALIKLHDNGELSEDVFRRIEHDLDLEESRLEY